MSLLPEGVNVGQFNFVPCVLFVLFAAFITLTNSADGAAEVLGPEVLGTEVLGTGSAITGLLGIPEVFGESSVGFKRKLKVELMIEIEAGSTVGSTVGSTDSLAGLAAMGRVLAFKTAPLVSALS